MILSSKGKEPPIRSENALNYKHFVNKTPGWGEEIRDSNTLSSKMEALKTPNSSNTCNLLILRGEKKGSSSHILSSAKSEKISSKKILKLVNSKQTLAKCYSYSILYLIKVV